jgi:signal transduction histidine kinase
VIDRLLTRLDNPRRHLTVLVGLLVLVFALTMVVAWRANTAERDRAAIARNTLAETAALALDDWSFLYGAYIGSALPHLATRLAKATVSLDSLLNAFSTGEICLSCDEARPVLSVFTIDPASGAVRTSGEPLNPGVPLAVRERMQSGALTKFHAFVSGGLYFVERDGHVSTAIAFLALDSDGSPARIAGIVIDEAMSREMLDAAFMDARRLQAALAPGATIEQLFARRAIAGDAQFIASGSTDALRVKEVDGPIYGLQLGIGPERSAPALLQFGADPVAERLTVMVLMLMISMLLVMALLQVRRETKLTRLRADFVSSVSHELRTPLAQIRMFTETLLLGRVRSDVERRRSLEIIDQEARRLAYLVENVLLFSKTEGGRQPRVTPEPTQFAEEVRQAVESFSLLSRHRDVEVRTELQENITVEVDRMALRQILINLVDNALKYGPAGQRITVGAALFDDVARLWVDDEGDGIPVEERARVFDSFYRLPRDLESRVTGSGIGLAVVRELARLHGGDAWAEAAPGRGARIVVEFPDAYVRSKEAGDFAAAS